MFTLKGITEGRRHKGGRWENALGEICLDEDLGQLEICGITTDVLMR